jgi:hypothetical protein
MLSLFRNSVLRSWVIRIDSCSKMSPFRSLVFRFSGVRSWPVRSSSALSRVVRSSFVRSSVVRSSVSESLKRLLITEKQGDRIEDKSWSQWPGRWSPAAREAGSQLSADGSPLVTTTSQPPHLPTPPLPPAFRSGAGETSLAVGCRLDRRGREAGMVIGWLVR